MISDAYKKGPGLTEILITGGTGSFGQAFVQRCLADESLERICVYSRGEHVQAQMRESIPDEQERLRWFIGDVRDRERLVRAMEGCDIVVHAAALKRIEVGAYNPEEMIKTNVGGAMNVISASRTAGIRRVVALSTDKAFQPVSPYGASKALAESLFLNANNANGRSGPVFVVTRYGNVAWSAGSVIPKWQALVRGGAITVPVTDPECTRFWMSMREAVAMVWEAATSHAAMVDRPLIPTLPAYRLADLAAAMGVEMEITGLPAWEKRHEAMGPDNSSEHARRLSVAELRGLLEGVA